MRRPALVVIAFFSAVAALSLAALPFASAQGPGGPGGPGGMRPGGPGGPGGMMAMPTDSFSAERDSLVKITLERYQGREDAPAESVFKNIQLMKGRSVRQVLNSMNGLGRTLGVSCRHCHIENHWAEDDKPAKKICRQMMTMTAALNDTLMARITMPDGDHPHAGCFTCHRGHANPNFGMPGRGPRPGGGPGGERRPDGDRH